MSKPQKVKQKFVCTKCTNKVWNVEAKCVVEVEVEEAPLITNGQLNVPNTCVYSYVGGAVWRRVKCK